MAPHPSVSLALACLPIMALVLLMDTPVGTIAEGLARIVYALAAR
ncbi:hypothetical protein J2045_003354 [Peteryoungia aggregata LMG 23059]|uniref:Uncharacterized protein n=1 Tax=Peteryoungia aggregata LMG 23059 TaxID=1368425 RepID=A0ABU0GAC6_9HYPH|nr:hypothetical protein [Peteryoungia aggregata]MDQ0422306.1 hypothetical protein [Peteryoungia aggregata LMG 23059]